MKVSIVVLYTDTGYLRTRQGGTVPLDLILSLSSSLFSSSLFSSSSHPLVLLSTAPSPRHLTTSYHCHRCCYCCSHCCSHCCCSPHPHPHSLSSPSFPSSHSQTYSFLIFLKYFYLLSFSRTVSTAFSLMSARV